MSHAENILEILAREQRLRDLKLSLREKYKPTINKTLQLMEEAERIVALSSKALEKRNHDK